ncbi:hypothetical protein [Helicobacter sp. T3_23-1056]
MQTCQKPKCENQKSNQDAKSSTQDKMQNPKARKNIKSKPKSNNKKRRKCLMK